MRNPIQSTRDFLTKCASSLVNRMTIMDDKKNISDKASSNEEPAIKPTAVDTGKRIDVSVTGPKNTTLRRRDERPPQQRRPRPQAEEAVRHEKHEKEEKQLAPAKSVEEAFRTLSEIETTEFDESGDFAAMLAESEALPNLSLQVGDKVSGKVVHIGKENIFVALGPKLEAAVATAEFLDENGQVTIAVNSTISAYVVSTYGGVTLSTQLAQSGLDAAMLEEALAKRIPVEGKILSVNKGGFDVQISGKRAFCPVGQIDLRFVEDPQSFVGRTEAFLIERIEEGGRNIVVSRKALLMREQREKAAQTVAGLEVGKRYDAVITRVTDFGAFADIGGLEGLIPRSEISHGHIDRVNDAVSTNDRVEVVVLRFEINEADLTKSRISFSLKKAKEDPYAMHWDKIKVGTTMEGRVVRLEPFGAFVELFPGIDGLIHISELSDKRVTHPKDVLSIGDPVSVHVLTVSESDKRIGLSLKEEVSRARGQAQALVKTDRGQKASGVVSRVERYGVFLELDNGVTALLPHSEMDLPKNTDLHRAFPIGNRVEVVVIDVDSQNRVRVSLIARKQMEDHDRYLEFKTEENKRAGSFGSFADLIKKHSDRS